MEKVMLDLSGRERATFPLLLPVKKPLRLFVKKRAVKLVLPNKRDTDRLLLLTGKLGSVDDEAADEAELLDMLAEATSIILSSNTHERFFSKARVEKMLSSDEMLMLVARYLDWLNQVVAEKN